MNFRFLALLCSREDLKPLLEICLLVICIKDMHETSGVHRGGAKGAPPPPWGFSPPGRPRGGRRPPLLGSSPPLQGGANFGHENPAGITAIPTGYLYNVLYDLMFFAPVSNGAWPSI